MSKFLEAIRKKLVNQDQLFKDMESLRKKREAYETLKKVVENPYPFDARDIPDLRIPGQKVKLAKGEIYLTKEDRSILSPESQAFIRNDSEIFSSIYLFPTSDSTFPDGIRIVFYADSTEMNHLPYLEENSHFALLPSGHISCRNIKGGKEFFKRENPPGEGVFGIVTKAIKDHRFKQI